MYNNFKQSKLPNSKKNNIASLGFSNTKAHGVSHFRWFDKSDTRNDQVARAIKIVLITMRIANDVSKAGPGHTGQKTSRFSPPPHGWCLKSTGGNKGLVWKKNSVYSGVHASNKYLPKAQNFRCPNPKQIYITGDIKIPPKRKNISAHEVIRSGPCLWQSSSRRSNLHEKDLDQDVDHHRPNCKHSFSSSYTALWWHMHMVNMFRALNKLLKHAKTIVKVIINRSCSRCKRNHPCLDHRNTQYIVARKLYSRHSRPLSLAMQTWIYTKQPL